MNGNDHSDQDLLDATRRGDRSAFGVLYERHRAFVWRTALRMSSGNETLALDVSQEVFAWLLGRCRRRLTLTSLLTTFLYPAIKNIMLSMLDRDRRIATGIDLPDQTAPPQAGTDHEAIEHVLASLGDGHREVVMLRFVESMSVLEIAAAMDIPVGTVKSRMHHALAALRNDPTTKLLLD